MYILKALPKQKDFIPLQELVTGSREEFNEVMKKVRKHYGARAANAGVIESWEKWDASSLPQTDSVLEYAERFVIIVFNSLSH